MDDSSSEFNENKEQALTLMQDLTSSLVLVQDKVNSALLIPDTKMMDCLANAIKTSYQATMFINNMSSIFNKAYANLSENINGIADLVDDGNTQLKSQLQSIKNDASQQNIQLQNTINQLNGKISQLIDSISYTEPNTNYRTEAQYLINNLRYDGKIIKGKALSESLLAYILEKRDEMLELREQNK